MEKININIWDDYHDDGYVPDENLSQTKHQPNNPNTQSKIVV